MIDYSGLYRLMQDTPLESWAESLPDRLERCFQQELHGDFDRWTEAIGRLPKLPTGKVELNNATVSIASDHRLEAAVEEKIRQLLKEMHPWRKGPYDLHGITIDTEWRSDWKWDRLASQIASLEDRMVLDVGCGNGYYCWRMAGAGARLVIGIDPTQLFLAQFLAVQHSLGSRAPVHMLPLGIEDVPPNLHAFDTVFSMGVLYHRRSPIDHLYELKGCLRQGEELILETLVIDGDEGQVLVPEGRYAKMRNVWFIPTPKTLAGWMKRCGFRNVRILDVTTTTVEEQRKTEWMEFESLADYLDPDNPELTIEGHPAPRRAILLATSK